MGEEHAVSLKLPTFWPSQPHVWFAQAEAQFNLRGIVADDTKYFHVVSVLDNSTAIRLQDIITKPPNDDKYTALKRRLLDTFGLSELQRASRLLHFRPLGDSKPSELMDEMLALLGDHPPCMFFRQLFLERLPEYIRTQLVDAGIADPRQMAKKADALWESRDYGASANAIRKSAPSPPYFPTPRAAFTEPHSPSTGKTRTTAQTTDPGRGYCYFHSRFGNAARRCRQPCTWTGNEQAGRL